MTTASEMFQTILHQEITEIYDAAEATLARPSVQNNPELREALTRAKDALFTARTLTDGREEKGA